MRAGFISDLEVDQLIGLSLQPPRLTADGDFRVDQSDIALQVYRHRPIRGRVHGVRDGRQVYPPGCLQALNRCLLGVDDTAEGACG